ncbi:MAG: phosphatase [Acutalibacteraceae bacterium]
MRIIADTHTHTIASTHAYSTAQEMIKAASEQGLYAIALTDHSYDMPGAPGTWYFDNLRAIPEEMYGVRVLRGAEANVVDYTGRLDLPEYLQKSLEWIVASIHRDTLKDEPPTVERCTQLWLNICKNPYVRVIGHSGNEDYKYDYEKVIPEFGKNGKLVEINNASFKVRQKSLYNCIEIAKICKKYSVPVVVNSDAHFSTAVGRVDDALSILKEIDFPRELIINSSKEKLKAYIEKYVTTLR